jgi:hypothetical protein
MPTESIASILRQAAGWTEKASSVLLNSNPIAFERLWDSLLLAIEQLPDSEGSGIARRAGHSPDWTFHALNSIAGDLAQAALHDPQLKGLRQGVGLPEGFKAHAEELLALDGDTRRHAITILSHQITWLYFIDSSWVKSNLLPFVEINDEDRDALWAGIFWASRSPQPELFAFLKQPMLALVTDQRSTQRKNLESLAALILSGWGKRDTESGLRIISDSEIRTAIIRADDEFRSHLIWTLERWSLEPNSRWNDDALTFLRHVWPKQLSAKTPRVTSRLCGFAFAHTDRFQEYVDAILPLVITADPEELNLPILRGSKDNLVEKYPDESLALLEVVLPKDAARWPYGIVDILKRISEADPALRSDVRLIELMRRWNSR